MKKQTVELLVGQPVEIHGVQYLVIDCDDFQDGDVVIDNSDGCHGIIDHVTETKDGKRYAVRDGNSVELFVSPENLVKLKIRVDSDELPDRMTAQQPRHVRNAERVYTKTEAYCCQYPGHATFYLLPEVQGIVSDDHAHRVACDVMGKNPKQTFPCVNLVELLPN